MAKVTSVNNKPHINVTPLIDVLLVMLIIFMVAAPLKPHSFSAKLPTEPDGRIMEPHPDTLRVTILSDGTLKLNELTKTLAAYTTRPN